MTRIHPITRKKARKLFFLFFMLLSYSSVFATGKDCLLDFQISMNELEVVYINDLRYCWDEPMIFAPLCEDEAHRSFQRGVREAGDTYDRCTRT